MSVLPSEQRRKRARLNPVGEKEVKVCVVHGGDEREQRFGCLGARHRILFREFAHEESSLAPVKRRVIEWRRLLDAFVGFGGRLPIRGGRQPLGDRGVGCL